MASKGFGEVISFFLAVAFCVTCPEYGKSPFFTIIIVYYILLTYICMFIVVIYIYIFSLPFVCFLYLLEESFNSYLKITTQLKL